MDQNLNRFNNMIMYIISYRKGIKQERKRPQILRKRGKKLNFWLEGERQT